MPGFGPPYPLGELRLRSTGAIQHFLKSTVKTGRQIRKKFRTCNAALADGW